MKAFYLPRNNESEFPQQTLLGESLVRSVSDSPLKQPVNIYFLIHLFCLHEGSLMFLISFEDASRLPASRERSQFSPQRRSLFSAGSRQLRGEKTTKICKLKNY